MVKKISKNGRTGRLQCRTIFDGKKFRLLMDVCLRSEPVLSMKSVGRFHPTKFQRLFIKQCKKLESKKFPSFDGRFYTEWPLTSLILPSYPLGFSSSPV